MIQGFSLTMAIKRVVDGTDLAHPNDIALKVVEQVPDAILREVLAEAIRDTVRSYLSRRRMSEARNIGSVISMKPKQVPGGKGNNSSKLAAYREAAPEWLRNRVAVGPVGDWKLLGECTVADLRYLARQRERNAALMETAARRYEKLAETMELLHVAYVRDLPELLLREAVPHKDGPEAIED